MSTLIIRKKSLKTWLHTDSVLGDFIISKFYFNADNDNFQVVEQGQSRRVIYDVSDITLYDDTDGGSAETFANITALSLRLEELNYPAFQYDGQIVSIANLIDAGTNVTITGDGTEASPYVISSSGGGGSQTLNETLVLGNETDGEDISISDGDKIVLDNGANLKKGTTDAGLGGAKGIALRCAVDYELKWEAGRLYVMGGDGFTIREVSHNFTITPTINDDTTKGFVVDSRWILDNGDVYVCTDATTGDAVWELKDFGTVPTLQQVTDAGNETTQYIKVKDSEKSFTLQSNGISFEDLDDGGNTLLRFEDTLLLDQEVLIRGLSGTLALLSDITTPSLKEVLAVEGRMPFPVTAEYFFESTNKSETIVVDTTDSLDFYLNDDTFAIGDEIEIYNKLSADCRIGVVGIETTQIYYKDEIIDADMLNMVTLPLYSKSWLKCVAENVFELVIIEQNEPPQLQDLQSVTDEGAITTNTISVQNGADSSNITSEYISANFFNTAGVGNLEFISIYYNQIVRRFWNGSAYITNIYTLPDIADNALEMLALTSDIPTVDATPTDGSSNAVSSNGVFDALALKQDKSTSETFVLSKANGTFGSHTGTTAETVLFSANISAGEFTAGDFMRVMLDITKLGTAGTANVRLRAGTAGTTSDALIGTLFLLSGTLDAGFIRERFQFLSGNLLSGIQNNYTSAQTDIALNSVIKQSTSLTPSNAWKLTVTVALTNSADTVSCLGYRVSKIKTI